MEEEPNTLSSLFFKVEEEPNTLSLYGTSQFTVNEDHKKHRRYHDLSMFQLIFSYVQRNDFLFIFLSYLINRKDVLGIVVKCRFLY